MLSSILRYIMCVAIALIIGMVLNQLWSQSSTYSGSYVTGISFLFIIYSILCTIIGCIILMIYNMTRGWASIDDIFLISSIVLFLGSLFIFRPTEFDGFHIAIIASGGILLFSIIQRFSNRR